MVMVKTTMDLDGGMGTFWAALNKRRFKFLSRKAFRTLAALRYWPRTSFWGGWRHTDFYVVEERETS